MTDNGDLAGYGLKVEHIRFSVGVDVGCVNFEALVKKVSVRVFEVKVLFLPSVINKYFVGRYF